MLHALRSETKRGGRPFLAGGVGDRSPAPRPSALARAQSAYGNQAMLRKLSAGSPVLNAAPGVLQRTCACGGAGGDCAECKEKEPGLQRKTATTGGRTTASVPTIVHDVLRSPGHPLDRGTRASMEAGFGRDFSAVRIHNDALATRSALAVNALAYTVGRDVVFARNQFAPGTKEGQRLLAHELAHVVQQGPDNRGAQSIGHEDDSFEREADRSAESIANPGARPETNSAGAAGFLQRTPARKVSCAPGPLNLPNGDVVNDPVGVITAAENRANALLDEAIEELNFTRQQILAGAAVGFPTISDALATGLRLIGLDPDSDRVWRQVGGPTNYTAELLLRRLRLIRGTIGSGSFFFTCLGPRIGTIGRCAGPICDDANAASCGGTFLIDFCEGFWTEDAEFQAGTVLHESAHNFADFIGANGEVGNRSDIAECYSRFTQVVAGTDLGGQRPDLCPDP